QCCTFAALAIRGCMMNLRLALNEASVFPTFAGDVDGQTLSDPRSLRCGRRPQPCAKQRSSSREDPKRGTRAVPGRARVRVPDHQHRSPADGLAGTQARGGVGARSALLLRPRARASRGVVVRTWLDAPEDHAGNDRATLSAIDRICGRLVRRNL